MIQFNLLPDVKLEYIKATYKRRIVTIFSFVIAGVFLLVFILMFLFVRVNQVKYMNDLDKDIDSGVAKLTENPDLDKILTIQNQLNKLPELHDRKVISSRLFDYMNQVTPNQASIASIDVDFEANSIILKGSADSIVTLNKFVDTLKFTDFKLEEEGNIAEGRAFNSVVLQSFSLESESNNPDTSEAVIYEIIFNFDPQIFKNTPVEGKLTESKVKLTVPKIITTRSETEKPANLFKEVPAEENQTDGGQ